MQNNRILKEYGALQRDTLETHTGIVKLEPIDDNLLEWQSLIETSSDSPYHSRKFMLDIEVQSEYPSKPPKIKFQPKSMPHPNVNYTTGEICLDILGDRWSPVYNLTYCIESILRLLNEPNPDSPLNLELAAILRANDTNAYNGLINYYLNC